MTERVSYEERESRSKRTRINEDVRETREDVDARVGAELLNHGTKLVDLQSKL